MQRRNKFLFILMLTIGSITACTDGQKSQFLEDPSSDAEGLASLVRTTFRVPLDGATIEDCEINGEPSGGDLQPDEISVWRDVSVIRVLDTESVLPSCSNISAESIVISDQLLEGNNEDITILFVPLTEQLSSSCGNLSFVGVAVVDGNSGYGSLSPGETQQLLAQQEDESCAVQSRPPLVLVDTTSTEDTPE